MYVYLRVKKLLDHIRKHVFPSIKKFFISCWNSIVANCGRAKAWLVMERGPKVDQEHFDKPAFDAAGPSKMLTSSTSPDSAKTNNAVVSLETEIIHDVPPPALFLSKTSLKTRCSPHWS